jgi:predicted dithiol-disulfide oxidoreductase (DUF899 family)
MAKHHVVGHEEWLQARKRFLEKEKAFTRMRDELSRERQELPWERVDKRYQFESDEGRETLADLFGGHNQLMVYHLMYAPEWEISCKSCAFWADNFNGIVPHLAQRGVAFAAISRAPLAKLRKQARDFGWTFKWVSSLDDFNYDYGVSFRKDTLERDEAYYNYGTIKVSGTDYPGVSAFFKDEDGRIYHTYSAYSRGIDMFNAAYQYLDAAPLGRNEQDLSYPMAWVKHRTAYGT